MSLMNDKSMTRVLLESGRLRRALWWVLVWLHAILIAIPAWWALVLAWPRDDTFSTSLSYMWFIVHWPHTEMRWSAAFALGAALGIPGILPRSLVSSRWRCRSAGVLGMMHFSMAWATVWSNPVSTHTAPYIGYAALAVLRIMLEVYL